MDNISRFKISIEQSIAIKGIAILLMFIHHFWNPVFVPYDKICYTYLFHNFTLEEILANYCKVCVSIFSFISGWAIYENHTKYCNSLYISTKISKFLFSYWIIAFSFLLIGIFSNDTLPSVRIFILNLFGFEVGAKETLHIDYINVTFAWYVRFYILVLLSAPLFIRLLNLHKSKSCIIYTFIIVYLLYIILREIDFYIIQKMIVVYFQWIMCILSGYLFNRDNLFSIFERLNSKIIFTFVLLTIPIRYYLCEIYGEFPIDFIFAPVIIYLIVTTILHKNSIFRKIFLFIGVLSMNLWFIQSIFFIPSLKWFFLLTVSENSIIFLLTGIILSIFISYLLYKIQSYILNIISRKKIAKTIKHNKLFN